MLNRATPGSPPFPEPELPGEFVSEDLRADCARFLSEQRALIGLRRELLRENPPPWVPGGAAAQSPPNSGSEHTGQ